MRQNLKTKIVAILNITPDSFTDGGKYVNEYDILERTEQLITEGAAIIDIGAESTRPTATPLNAEQEWNRLRTILPKIINLCHNNNILVSLDSYHKESVSKAIKLGIDWINDVRGFQDPEMIAAVKSSDVKILIMHSLSVPADKNIIISGDPVSEVKNWAKNKIGSLMRSGINLDRIIFDPGIGFGKNSLQSWQLVNNISEFKDLMVPIYIGHSKKSFLGEEVDKAQATIQLSKKLIESGVDYIRVHDVKEHVSILY
jgi:dihydropteroate synthase